MSPENLTQGALDLVAAYPYVTGAMAAAVGVFAYFKLKLVLKMLVACLALGAIAYVILFIVDLTSTGIESTEKFLDRPNQAIDKM